MKRKAVIIQHSANLDGSSFSALMLADGLKEVGWDTHIVFSYEGPIIQRFKDAGHRTLVVPHKSWLRTTNTVRFIKNFFNEISASKKIVEVCHHIGPDVIYVNTAVGLGGSIAAFRLNIPCVWHIRELFLDVSGEMKAPRFLYPLVRYLFNRLSSKLVVNSEAVAINMLGRYRHKALVVPNAVHENFYNERRSIPESRALFDLPTDRPVLGVPGTLRPMKGHPFFLRSFVHVLKKNADIVAAIPGGGNKQYTEELYSLVHDLGIEQNIKFLGYVEDMPAFYRACDIACIPSVAEPFGRTVIEAFASNTPVVATAVGGMKETINSGQNGLLVDYGDAEALSQAINDLLLDDEKKAIIVQNARKEAEEKYRAPVYKARLCDIVEQVSRKSAQ